MARIEKPAVQYIIDELCDACGAGFMRPTGVLLMSDPPKYPHRCTACDAHKNYTIQFPYTEARVVAAHGIKGGQHGTDTK